MGEIAQSGSGAPPAFPVVRAATFEDVRAALSEGWRDFTSAPLMVFSSAAFTRWAGCSSSPPSRSSA